MKYYSEVTEKTYDTVAELQKAEDEVKNAKTQRAARAKEVEKAIEEANAAQEKANNLLNKFLKDYGSFHTTVKNNSYNSRGHRVSFSTVDEVLDDIVKKILE